MSLAEPTETLRQNDTLAEVELGTVHFDEISESNGKKHERYRKAFYDI